MTTLVCFRTADREYAVPVERVREVRGRGALTTLPVPRPGVVGLMPYRGEALTVVDPLGAGGGPHHVLLLERDDHTFGLLVDEVTRLVDVDDIGPAPEGQASTFVSGVLSTGGGMTLVVDVEMLDEEVRA
jgi:purine-binding chemotaxis protein CheW